VLADRGERNRATGSTRTLHQVLAACCDGRAQASGDDLEVCDLGLHFGQFRPCQRSQANVRALPLSTMMMATSVK
jgi:hypothetical protein